MFASGAPHRARSWTALAGPCGSGSLRHGSDWGRLRFSGNVLLPRRLIRWLWRPQGIPWPFHRTGGATVDAEIDRYCFTVSAR
jgi:hypothetical protein